MAIGINNTNTLQASYYTKAQEKNTQELLKMLSSGSQLTQAAADSAGMAIADSLSAQLQGFSQAIQNINDSVGLLQTADGGLNGINDNLSRIRTLTLQASNDTLSSSDRAVIQKEIDGLLKSSNDIATQTRYNGMSLLDGTAGNGSGTLTIQSGANAQETQSVTLPDARVSSLVGSIDVTTESGRSTALNTLDNAMQTIDGSRATIGASQNALRSTLNNISLSRVNTAESESKIRDIDFAAASANFTKANILTQTGVFAQAQSNGVNTAKVAGLLS